MKFIEPNYIIELKDNILKFDGNIIIYEHTEMYHYLEEMEFAIPADEIVFDLTKLDSMNSLGIYVLARFCTRSEKKIKIIINKQLRW